MIETDEEILNKAKNMAKRIISVLNATWNTIASDIMAVEIPGHKKKRFMKAKEVREVVTDANYLEHYGGDKEVVEYFRKLPRKTQDYILKKAFPYKTYE